MNEKAKSTLKVFEKSLRLKNYSERTISSYSSYCEKFIKANDKNTYELNINDLTLPLLFKGRACP